MTTRTHVPRALAALLALTLATAAPAHAQEVAPPEPAQHQRMQRAKFSSKRLVVEILVGEAVGMLVAQGTFSALCDSDAGESCMGAGLLAWLADFAVTPAAVYGTGQLMGGQGRLLYAYLGASPALAAFSVPGAPDETPGEALSRIKLQMTLSALFLPICSALLYEVSSHVASVQWTREHAPQLAFQPLRGRDGIDGGIGTLSLRF